MGLIDRIYKKYAIEFDEKGLMVEDVAIRKGEMDAMLQEYALLKNLDNIKPIIPCNSITDVRQNAVAILGLIGNPNLHRREDLKEIDDIAKEIYEYCVRSSEN